MADSILRKKGETLFLPQATNCKILTVKKILQQFYSFLTKSKKVTYALINGELLFANGFPTERPQLQNYNTHAFVVLSNNTSKGFTPWIPPIMSLLS